MGGRELVGDALMVNPRRVWAIIYLTTNKIGLIYSPIIYELGGGEGKITFTFGEKGKNST